MLTNTKSDFIILLKELTPESIVYKTMSYTLTAQEMLKELEGETSISKEWVSSVLSISRDMLIRQAARNA